MPVRAQLRTRPDFFEQGQRQFSQEIQNLQKGSTAKAPLLTIGQDTLQWHPLILREEGIAIWLPQGSLTQEMETLEAPNGQSVKFRIIAAHPQTSRFVVAYSEPLDRSLLVDPLKLFDWVRDDIHNRENGFELTDDSANTFRGYPTKDFTIQSQEELITFRLLLIDEKIYILAVRQPREVAEQGAITNFFESFQIYRPSTLTPSR